jgi:hypothetical protein
VSDIHIYCSHPMSARRRKDNGNDACEICHADWLPTDLIPKVEIAHASIDIVVNYNK